MHDLNSKSAAETADLYRFDGRFYDLDETDGVLTLRLRRSVIWERSVVAILTLLLAIGAFFLFVLNFERFDPNIAGTAKTFFLQMLASPFLFMAVWVVRCASHQTWVFDRNTAKLRWNTTEFGVFSKIRTVNATRRGNRFYIALKMRNGMSAKIGHFGFCRSEHSWRQDAAQIATFLNVPLEIPEV